MARFFLLFFLLLSTVGLAQNVEFKNLGVINGETKTKSFRIERPKDQFGLLFLMSSEKHVSIEKQRSLDSDSVLIWNADIDLKGRIGSHVDSLQFYTADSILVESILVDYQILQPVQNTFESYKNEYWPFRAKEQVFNLRSAVQGDTLRAEFDLYNFSGKKLELNSAFISDSISISFDPSTVEHHTFTKVSFEFATTDTSQVGFDRRVVPILNQQDTVAFFPIQYSIVPSSSGTSKVQVNRSRFDFKVVRQGEVKNEVTFLSNNGTEPIEILKVESNCDCLTYEINEPVIPPGGNVQLKVQFDSEGRLGLEQKTISVFFKDSSQPVVNFTFKAHVKK